MEAWVRKCHFFEITAQYLLQTIDNSNHLCYYAVNARNLTGARTNQQIGRDHVMKRLVCEMCGSSDIQKQEGLYVCTSCGTKYSPEEAKKLFVEVTVTVDNTEEAKNLYQLATRARKNGDDAAAANYYAQYLSYDPDNWEAAFFATVCRSSCDTIANIDISCDAVRNCLDSVFAMIKKLPAAEQKAAAQTVVTTSTAFAQSMFAAAVKHHSTIDASVMSRFAPELRKRLTAACYVMTSCCGTFMGYFENDKAIAPLVQIPAKAALESQTLQHYVNIPFEPAVSNGLLTYIGRFDPAWVTNFKKKQNNTMLTGSIVLMVLGAIFLVLGLLLNGTFAKWFCLPMAGFCLLWGIFRLIVQAANKKLNG